MMGSTFAFARTAADAGADAATRARSIEERYAAARPTWRGCARTRTRWSAARQLLAEDVDAVVERAGALWDFVCPR